jgi:hypothetical protein
LFFNIAFACLFFSCKKTNDPIEQAFDGTISGTVQHKVKELKDCRVQQIINYPCCGLKDTLAFSYNSWGDPDTIKRLPFTGTGSPNYIFRYDKKRRLTDMLGLYDGNGGLFWHKYFYENPGNSNIVMDSTFYFVRLRNGMLDSYVSSLTTYYTYDKWDRIIKDSTIFPSSFANVSTFMYDANGNRTGRTYDNKVNIHRTNKIWMFFDRDYSMNNPFSAESYNAEGLPAEFHFTFNDPYFLNFITEIKDAKITYTCD